MRPAAVLFVLPLLPLACAGSEAPPRADPGSEGAETAALREVSLGSTELVHEFEGVYLASQPSAEDLALAKREGIRTVIDLRHAHEPVGFDEPALARELGLEYVRLPWNGADEMTDEVLDRARELLATAERPVLLHCASSNRTGAVWLPYRVLDGGLAWDEALAEARRVGLRTSEYEARAADYVARRR